MTNPNYAVGRNCGLVSFAKSQGDNTTADRAAEPLPDEIDTEHDHELLAMIGLSPDRLSAHLAAASIHPIG